MVQIEEKLAHEAEYFHQSLFQKIIPRELCSRYIESHRFIFKQGEEQIRMQELRLVEKIVDHQLDIEAIELVLRRYSPQNLLTQKIHILLYLAENDPKYYSHFYNKCRRHFFSFFILGFYLLQSVFKFLKGKFLIWRYNLA